MVVSLQAEIIENKKILPEFFQLTLNAPEIARDVQPGQFVMLKVSESLDPFLKRPISINTIDPHKGTITLIYQVIGKGTKFLTKMLVGDTINVLGPLGQGFSRIEQEKSVVLVGGGCGIAPLLALAEKLVNEKKQVYVLLGAQNKSKLINKDEFIKLGCTVEVATDDGSAGQKGFVTELLNKLLAAAKIDQIYCCGPLPMTKEIIRISKKAFIPCQISLEERMGCGLGACIGCVIKVRDENGIIHHKKVCSDGPVFTSSEVIFDE